MYPEICQGFLWKGIVPEAFGWCQKVTSSCQGKASSDPGGLRQRLCAENPAFLARALCEETCSRME